MSTIIIITLVSTGFQLTPVKIFIKNGSGALNNECTGRGFATTKHQSIVKLEFINFDVSLPPT